jgi:hypothetical protein
VAISRDGAVLKRDTTRPTDVSELNFSLIYSLVKVAVTANATNSSSQTAMMPDRIQCWFAVSPELTHIR